MISVFSANLEHKICFNIRDSKTLIAYKTDATMILQ